MPDGNDKTFYFTATALSDIAIYFFKLAASWFTTHY